MKRAKVETIVLLGGLLTGALAFGACYAPCPEREVEYREFESGIYESNHRSTGARDIPHVVGAETKTLFLDVEANEVIIRYFDAQGRPVAETWRLGAIEEFEGYSS